jgi:hypothetical protein
MRSRFNYHKPTSRQLIPLEEVLPTVCKVHNFRIDYEREHANEANPSRWKKKKKYHKWINFIDINYISLSIYSFVLSLLPVEKSSGFCNLTQLIP